MKSLNYGCSMNQAALCKVIYRQMTHAGKDQMKRIFVEVASGQGKSRIILSIAAMFTTGAHRVNKITLVYSEQDIATCEQDLISKAEKLNNAFVTEVKLIADLPQTLHLQEGTLTIVDEADMLLLKVFGGATKLQLSGQGYLLCVSATGIVCGTQPEAKFIMSDALQLKCFKAEWGGVDMTKLLINECKDFAAFLDTTPGTGKVAYVKAESIEAYKATAEMAGLKAYVDVGDIEQLRHIKENQVYFTTEQKFMRGYDYRSDNEATGLALYMENQVVTARDWAQALGRVGRLGETCQRYMKKGMQKFDNDKHEAHNLAFHHQQ